MRMTETGGVSNCGKLIVDRSSGQSGSILTIGRVASTGVVRLGAACNCFGPLFRPLRVAALAAGLGLAPCAAVAQEFVELPQSIVQFGPGVTVAGPASPDAPVHFQVALKLRNFNELQDRLAAGQQVAYPELAQQYLPTEQDYGRVVAWLRGQGLTIERTVQDRMTVAAAGTVASVSRALGASFTHIISEGQEYVSASSASRFPRSYPGSSPA